MMPGPQKTPSTPQKIPSTPQKIPSTPQKAPSGPLKTPFGPQKSHSVLSAPNSTSLLNTPSKEHNIVNKVDLKISNMNNANSKDEVHKLTSSGETGRQDVTSQVKLRGAVSETEETEYKSPEKYCYMNDGKRRIDFVLVNDHVVERNQSVTTGNLKTKRIQERNHQKELQKVGTRRMFERYMTKEGLEFEIDVDKHRGLRFTKIHVPWGTVTRYAEMLGYDMPIAKNDLKKARAETTYSTDKWKLPIIEYHFAAPFSAAKQQLFLIEDEQSFFNPGQRSNIANFILSRGVGLNTLYTNNIYSTGYPLHSGELDTATGEEPAPPHVDDKDMNLRLVLSKTWGKLSLYTPFKKQPLDHIARYFGDSYGFYFGFTELYNKMLIPLSIIGITLLMYGMVTMNINRESDEVCSKEAPGNWTMCPKCDGCPFWTLHGICWISRMKSVFENDMSILFVLVIPIWGAVFLELWKRQEVALIQDWHLHNFLHIERIRPAYHALASVSVTNPVTGNKEWVVPKKTIYFRALVSITCVAVILGSSFYGFYNIAKQEKDWYVGVDEEVDGLLSSLITCVFYVLFISLTLAIFIPLAKVLTHFETPRTERDWAKSYMLKVFLFQFVNAIIFLFTRKTASAQVQSKRKPSIETEIQIIDQFSGNVLFFCVNVVVLLFGQQIGVMMSRLPRFLINKLIRVCEAKESNFTPWYSNYRLTQLPENILYDEYIRYVLQYGILTCFAAAFQFGAIFAIIFNTIMIRLFAYQMLVSYRKPMSMPCPMYHIWLPVMKTISKLATVSNAAFIAFSSEFIERQFFTHYVQAGHRDVGYMVEERYTEFVLSKRPAKEYQDSATQIPADGICWDYGFFEDNSDYKLTKDHWIIQSIKWMFMICYPLFVALISSILFIFMPEERHSVKIQRLRETRVAEDIFMVAAFTARSRRPTKQAKQSKSSANSSENSIQSTGTHQKTSEEDFTLTHDQRF